jgi:hypothetical protein
MTMETDPHVIRLLKMVRLGGAIGAFASAMLAPLIGGLAAMLAMPAGSVLVCSVLALEFNGWTDNGWRVSVRSLLISTAALALYLGAIASIIRWLE